MSARFEIVRTDAEQPWHARFRAENGRVVWSTENYARRKTAINAVCVIAREFSWGGVATWRTDGPWQEVLIEHGGFRAGVPVLMVDERTQP